MIAPRAHRPVLIAGCLLAAISYVPIYQAMQSAAGSNVVTATSQRNPVTGAEHRVGIYLPQGFEYTLNEVGRGWSQSSGRTALTLQDSYAHWCEIHLNQDGVIRDKAA